MSETPPPRWVLWALDRLLPADERAEIVGDLHEEFRQRVGDTGVLRARLWFVRQALVLMVKLPMMRPAASLDVHRDGLWTSAAADAQQAWRSLRRSPAFALVAVMSLSVSVGLATAVFSVVDGILLRPLPFAGADRIVRLGQITKTSGIGGPAPATIGGAPRPPRLGDVMIGAWMAGTTTLDPITPYAVNTQTVATAEEALRLDVAEVGAGFFDVLPVRPRAGRTLLAADSDSQAPAVVIISERLWQQHFGRRDGVLGSLITVGDAPYLVVGVVPSAFDLPDAAVDLWIPGKWHWPPPGVTRMVSRSVETIARMRPGVNTAQVEVEGQSIAARIGAATPGSSSTATPVIVARSLIDEIVAPARPALLLLSAGTIVVLLAACVNLANLLFARNTARHRDVAVRQALGASRWRIVRPLLFEQLILSGCGGAGGGLLAWWTLRVLPRLAPPDLPRLSHVSFDLTSLIFASAIAVLTAIAVGILPAWQIPAAGIRAVTAAGGASVSGTGRRAERIRGALVVCQVALAALLLVGSALTGRSLWSMLRIEPGYRPAGVLTFQVGMDAGAARQPGRRERFYTELLARLRTRPGVISVATSNGLPLHGETVRVSVQTPGVPSDDSVDRPLAHLEVVSPTYWETIGATLTRGRSFDDRDTLGDERVAIVNEPFVRAFLPGVDPIGQHVSYGVNSAVIVGVVAPIKRGVTVADDDQAMYMPAGQVIEGVAYSGHGMGVVVRTSDDPLDLVPFIRSQVHELEPLAPLFNVMRLEDRLGRTFAQPRFYTVALALFAALSLSTAVLGIYGVLAYAVERRRAEFGVRRALGASEEHVIRLVLRHAFALAAAGLAAGFTVAIAGSYLVRSLLFGVPVLDVASYVASTAVVLIVVLLAAWQPVRRALRINPALALRLE